MAHRRTRHHARLVGIMLLDDRLDPHTLKVWAMLDLLGNMHDGWSWWHSSPLAAKCGLARSTLWKSLQRLQNIGLVEVRRGKDRDAVLREYGGALRGRRTSWNESLALRAVPAEAVYGKDAIRRVFEALREPLTKSAKRTRSGFDQVRNTDSTKSAKRTPTKSVIRTEKYTGDKGGRTQGSESEEPIPSGSAETGPSQSLCVVNGGPRRPAATAAAAPLPPGHAPPPSPASRLAEVFRECLAKHFGGARSSLGGREMSHLADLARDFGEEMTERMIYCLILDWVAFVDSVSGIGRRWGGAVPTVVCVFAFRNDLAGAVSSGKGLTSRTHRVSRWAQSRKGSDSGWRGSWWRSPAEDAREPQVPAVPR